MQILRATLSDFFDFKIILVKQKIGELCFIFLIFSFEVLRMNFEKLSMLQQRAMSLIKNLGNMVEKLKEFSSCLGNGMRGIWLEGVMLQGM